MKTFEYKIIRSARRKTASIIIKPDKSIHVVIPAFVPESEVEDLVTKKKNWINKKLAQLEETELTFSPHNYKEGEFFPFLGKNFRLSTPPGPRKAISLTEDSIIVTVPHKLPKKIMSRYIQSSLYQWYNRRALEILTDKTQALGERFQLQPTSIGIKDYKSRWGCCFWDGRVYFNWRIIAAPEHIIDYVITHELCHLVEPNHSKKYWQIVERLVPDWREYRGWLRKNGFTLEI